MLDINKITNLIKVPLSTKTKEFVLLSNLGIKVLIISDISSKKIQNEIKKLGKVDITEPKYGRFDPYQPILSQVDKKIDCKKYDFILIARDLPKKNTDKNVAKYILSENNTDLKKIKNLIEKSKKIKPSFPEKMKKRLVDFYVLFRQESKDDGTISPILITPNNLSILEKTSFAYAKLRQSKKVMLKDLQKATELYQFQLGKIGYDLKKKDFNLK